MRMKILSTHWIGGAMAAMLFMASQMAHATHFTLHYTNSTSTSLPTSYQDAVDNNFYFIFDSFYQDPDSGEWQGGFVNLQAEFLGFPIDANCRTELGGYIWEDESDVVRIAVTHSQVGKAPPPGEGDNDDNCDNIQASHNNGEQAHPGFSTDPNGAWGTEASASDVNVPPSLTDFENVQVVTSLGDCSTATGNGGVVEATYDDNGSGNRVSFSFSDTITPAASQNCQVTGEFFSVDDGPIADSAHTPGTPNPSPASRGIVDSVSNP